MVFSPLLTPLILLGESVLEALRAKHRRAQDLDNALLLQGPIEEVNAIIFDELDASAIRNAALHIRMVLQVYLALMLSALSMLFIQGYHSGSVECHIKSCSQSRYDVCGPIGPSCFHSLQTDSSEQESWCSPNWHC